MTLEVVTESEEGTFELAPLGQLLRRDVPDSLAAWTRWWGGHLWPVFGRLLDSVRTGDSARALVYGSRGFSHLEQDPEAAATFNRALAELTRLHAAGVVEHFDFSPFGVIVDVGGGYGELLATVLARCPRGPWDPVRSPARARGAREHLGAAGVSERCEFIAGDFFEAVPSGGDVYVLKSVLHDWDDEHALRLLEACRRALCRSAGRLLVVEPVLRRARGRGAASPARPSDLTMLVAHGACERTEEGIASCSSEPTFTSHASSPPARSSACSRRSRRRAPRKARGALKKLLERRVREQISGDRASNRRLPSPIAVATRRASPPRRARACPRRRCGWSRAPRPRDPRAGSTARKSREVLEPVGQRIGTKADVVAYLIAPGCRDELTAQQPLYGRLVKNALAAPCQASTPSPEATAASSAASAAFVLCPRSRSAPAGRSSKARLRRSSSRGQCSARRRNRRTAGRRLCYLPRVMTGPAPCRRSARGLVTASGGIRRPGTFSENVLGSCSKRARIRAAKTARSPRQRHEVVFHARVAIGLDGA